MRQAFGEGERLLQVTRETRDLPPGNAACACRGWRFAVVARCRYAQGELPSGLPSGLPSTASYSMSAILEFSPAPAAAFGSSLLRRIAELLGLRRLPKSELAVAAMARNRLVSTRCVAAPGQGGIAERAERHRAEFQELAHQSDASRCASARYRGRCQVCLRYAAGENARVNASRIPAW